MRVLHFYSTYHPDTFGGAESAISQICQATAKLGVVPTVLTLSRNPVPRKLNVDSINVERAKTSFEIASTRFSFDAPRILRDLIRENDIVHYHFPWPFADLCQLTLLEKKPYLVTYHSDIVKQKLLLKLYSPLMNQFLGRANHIVATSPNYFESSQVLQKFKSKVSVIPLAISQSSYPQAQGATLAKWRTRLGEQPFFLFVGVLRYYKGLHLLIEAVRDTNLRVVIVGAGPEENSLKKQSQGLDNVVFLGQISEVDKIALFTIAFAFVFPSHLRSEAFGVSLLEAGLFGLPSIAFDLGTGTSFVIENNVTGLLIKLSPLSESNASVQELHGAMHRLRMSPEVALQMGAAARSRIEKLFNVQATANEYFAIYSALLAH